MNNFSRLSSKTKLFSLPSPLYSHLVASESAATLQKWSLFEFDGLGPRIADLGPAPAFPRALSQSWESLPESASEPSSSSDGEVSEPALVPGRYRCDPAAVGGPASPGDSFAELFPGAAAESCMHVDCWKRVRIRKV